MNELVNDRVVLRSVSVTEPLSFSFNGEVHGLISHLYEVTALMHGDELICERHEIRRFGRCGLEVFSHPIECPALHFEQKTSTSFGQFIALSPSRNGQSFVASGGEAGDPFRYRSMFSITNRLSVADKSPLTQLVRGSQRVRKCVSVNDFGLVFFADGAWFPGIGMPFSTSFLSRSRELSGPEDAVRHRKSTPAQRQNSFAQQVHASVYADCVHVGFSEAHFSSLQN